MEGAGQWARPAVLSLSVQNTADQVPWIELAELQLLNADGQVITRNGKFLHGLTHWRQAAGGYYVPWHIDNLLLEWLIERGWFGLFPLVALFALAVLTIAKGRVSNWNTLPNGRVESRSVLTWVLLTVLASVALLGLVASIMDVPRVSFLLWWLVLGSGAGLWSFPQARA
jgi:hypothetical protein